MLAQTRRSGCGDRCSFDRTVVGLSQTQAIADPPLLLRDYRFVTDKSTVEVTGGICWRRLAVQRPRSIRVGHRLQRRVRWTDALTRRRSFPTRHLRM